MASLLESTLFTQLRDEGKLPEVPISFTRQTLIDLTITVLIIIVITLLLIAVIKRLQ